MPHFSIVFLAIAAIPFIYYLIAIFSSWQYFRQPATKPDLSFTPPVSILKPIRGLDPDAEKNLASFCRLDYPEFEIVFCVDPDDEARQPNRQASQSGHHREHQDKRSFHSPLYTLHLLWARHMQRARH